MDFYLITIFPQIFDSYFSESILLRAQKENKIKIRVENLRDYTKDKRKTVDDTPYGGGAGMVMKVEPIFDCVNKLKSEIVKKETTRIILLSAKGKRYNQADAKRLAKYENLIFICGRYEGVDERVAEHIADEEISVGDYILTGGELPAMIIIDSVSRLIPGVLGNTDSLTEESFSFDEGISKQDFGDKKTEYPQYTKPEEFNGWKVPEILLSGNHGKIEKWREDKRR